MRLYVGMYRPTMGHHVAELFEPHWTVWARTSQLPVVPSLDVLLKCLTPGVTPRALRARERLLDVCLRVKHKALFLHELLAANRALKRLVVRVRPHVALKDEQNPCICRVRKCFHSVRAWVYVQCWAPLKSLRRYLGLLSDLDPILGPDGS